MKTCSVIVTYADRFHLLKEVIASCLAEGVDKLIIVDNNSDENSKNQLKNIERQLNDKITVIYLSRNTGSAYGYKKGLEEANKEKECDYIWLLDDDNKPQRGALQVLKSFWSSLNREDKNEKVSLLSYREDRKLYKDAIATGHPDLVLGRRNSFMGFHFMNYPVKLIKVLKKALTSRSHSFSEEVKSGLVSVAPYGGMFFHKEILKTVGYPNEKFYVYADDHDWSYTITKNSGSIYLLLDSKIDDIDTSWHISQKNESIFKIIPNQNPFRVYYTTRNRVYFELEHLVDNIFVYQFNRVVFQAVLLFFSFKKLSTYKLFCDAIKDAFNKNMGKNDNIQLSLN